MNNLKEEYLTQFVQACHKVADYNLLSCSSGNLSWRVGDQVLITESRSWIKEIRADQVVIADLPDGKVLNGKRPSVEFGFHKGILNNRPDMDVVLHFQTPHATTLACRKDLNKINFFVIPEIVFYIQKIGIVPYLIPGSDQLADFVINTMKENNLVVMQNHGMVIGGKTFDEVIQNAVFFELACQIIVNGGENIRPLSAEEICCLNQI